MNNILMYCLKKSDYFIFIIIIIVLSVVSFLQPYLLFAIIFLSILFLFKKIYNTHNLFIVFMLFYGLFSRFVFYFTRFYMPNPIFLIPPLYAFIHIKDIIDYIFSLKKHKIIFIMIFMAIGIVYSVFVNYTQIYIQLISFFVMFVPLIYFLSIDFMKIYKIMIYSAPIILIYSIFQFFNIFLPSDRLWILLNHMNTFDSLKLGGNIRPFAVFTSIEEYGYYLLFLILFAFIKRDKVSISLAICSFILLFVFSIRMPIFIFIIVSIYALLTLKKWKYLVYIVTLIIIFIGIISFIPFKDDIHSSEKGLHISIRHSLEPFSKLFNVYSIEKRFEELKYNIEYFKNYPFGCGLTHNSRILKHNYNNTNIESAFIQLVISCGIIILIYLIIVYILYVKKLIIYSNHNMFLFTVLLMIIFSHALSFHFITPFIYKILIEDINV